MSEQEFETIIETLQDEWPIAALKIRGLLEDYNAERARSAKLNVAIGELKEWARHANLLAGPIGKVVRLGLADE